MLHSVFFAILLLSFFRISAYEGEFMSKDAALLKALAPRTGGILSELRIDPCLEECLLHIPDKQYTLAQWQYALSYLWQTPCQYSSIKELKTDLRRGFAASRKGRAFLCGFLKNN